MTNEDYLYYLPGYKLPTMILKISAWMLDLELLSSASTSAMNLSTRYADLDNPKGEL